MRRGGAVAGALLLWWGFGPWLLLLALASLAHPAVRDWLADGEPLADRFRVVAVTAAVSGAVALVVVLAPDGWLPIPSGPGRLVTPAYVGRAAIGHEVSGVPAGPSVVPWSGPEGDSTEVGTAWWGADCRTLLPSGEGLLGLCGHTLRLIEPGSMHVSASAELTGSACEPVLGLDGDHPVVVDGRSVRRWAPSLGASVIVPLPSPPPPGDCVVGLSGSWFVTASGRVGVLGRRGGAVLRLDEHVARPLVADGRDAYAVTDDALYRLALDRSGRPRVVWRTTYDNGIERKPGQPSQGSGTVPALLPGGLVAITDNADPRMDVLFLRRDNGDEVCRSPVFEADHSATSSTLVPVGPTSVVVTNSEGYGGTLATVLGRTTSPGLARVDVRETRCHVAWTSDQVAPSASGVMSSDNGLLYTYTTRHSWWGVNAWYLTALDVTTGRAIFSVRTGTGRLFANDHAPVVVTRDGSAYVPTLGGLVRVHDRGDQG